jgi:hypothetical protein
MVRAMRNHLTRSVAIIALVALGTGATAAAAPPAAPQPGSLELVDMPDQLATWAHWAVDLFAEAGLELPPIRYRYHDRNMSLCNGRDGLQHTDGALNVIELCTTRLDFGTQVMILHETAHAWADHTLTEGTRARFQALRGWTYWRNYEKAPWHENGTEQAAEIMVWGLIDRPIAMVRIYQNSCDDLLAGYLVLTGRQPLHGFTDYC